MSKQSLQIYIVLNILLCIEEDRTVFVYMEWKEESSKESYTASKPTNYHKNSNNNQRQTNKCSCVCEGHQFFFFKHQRVGTLCYLSGGELSHNMTAHY